MIAVLALLAVAAPPEGVVRVAFGTTLARASGATTDGGTGQVLGANDRVSTGDEGYAELQLGRGARLRLSALTRVLVNDADHLDLASGRLWVQAGGEPFDVAIGAARVRVDARSSVAVERSPTGVTVTVRAGRATLATLDGDLVVGVGQIARSASRGRGAAVRPGGRALADLVASEAREALGDVLGFEAFLLERALSPRQGVARATVDTGPFTAYADRVRGSREGPAGLELEDAIRPPPFFDDEVPPKGPNVRVDVTFQEQ